MPRVPIGAQPPKFQKTARTTLDEWSIVAHRRLDEVWTSDVFPDTAASAGAGVEIITLHEMLVFGGLLCAFAAMHNLMVSRMAPTLISHISTLLLWLVCAAIYNVFIWVRHGADIGSFWATGYLLEWMLSLDNLFVLHLIFKCFKTPPEELEKALFLGITGAVYLRIVFFSMSYSFLQYLSIARYIFGSLLVYSGIQGAIADDEEDEDISESYMVVSLKKCLGERLVLTYSNNSVFLWDLNGKLQVTMLLPVVLVLECTDLVFAVDSVAAKIGLIPDRYIAYTSTVVAMFGLRAMFFVVQYLVECFDMLKYGIAVILVFIGAQLMLHDFISLSPRVALGVITSTVLVSILASLAMPRSKDAEEPPTSDSEAVDDAKEAVA